MTEEINNEESLPAVASVALPPAPPTPVAGPTTQGGGVTRARSTLVGLVPLVQYRIARVGALGVTGIAALVAAAVIAVSVLIPAHNAIQSLSSDIDRAQHRPHATETPEEGLGRFVGTLPTRSQMPAVIGQILQQARQAGVSLDSGHYAYSPAKAGGVSRYELEFPVKASYPQVRDFINRTLTAVPAAGLDKLHIERKTVSDATVNANVGFVVFVRGGE